MNMLPDNIVLLPTFSNLCVGGSAHKIMRHTLGPLYISAQVESFIWELDEKNLLIDGVPIMPRGWTF